MPLFVYACAACGHRFEELVFGSETVACPSCKSKGVERQLSTFAVRGEASADVEVGPTPGACGTCGDPRGQGACDLD